MGMVEQIAGDTALSRNSNYIERMLRVRSGSSTTENESRLTTAYQAWIRTTSRDAAPPAALRPVSAARGLSLLRGQFGPTYPAGDRQSPRGRRNARQHVALMSRQELVIVSMSTA